MAEESGNIEAQLRSIYRRRVAEFIGIDIARQRKDDFVGCLWTEDVRQIGHDFLRSRGRNHWRRIRQSPWRSPPDRDWMLIGLILADVGSGQLRALGGRVIDLGISLPAVLRNLRYVLEIVPAIHSRGCQVRLWIKVKNPGYVRIPGGLRDRRRTGARRQVAAGRGIRGVPGADHLRRHSGVAEVAGPGREWSGSRDSFASAPRLECDLWMRCLAHDPAPECDWWKR